MARSKKKNNTPFKSFESTNLRGIESGYMRITESLHYSDAMKDLTPLEYRVFMDMKHVSKGHEIVLYSREKAYENTGVCAQKFKEIKQKLEMVGLIKNLPRCQYGASRIKFSDEWHKYISPNRDPLTREYVRKKSKTEFPSKK